MGRIMTRKEIYNLTIISKGDTISISPWWYTDKDESINDIYEYIQRVYKVNRNEAVLKILTNEEFTKICKRDWGCIENCYKYNDDFFIIQAATMYDKE